MLYIAAGNLIGKNWVKSGFSDIINFTMLDQKFNNIIAYNINNVILGCGRKVGSISCPGMAYVGIQHAICFNKMNGFNNAQKLLGLVDMLTASCHLICETGASKCKWYNHSYCHYSRRAWTVSKWPKRTRLSWSICHECRSKLGKLSGVQKQARKTTKSSLYSLGPCSILLLSNHVQ